MPKYSLTRKGNVVQCKWNCTANHEHFVGSYERAIKYFGIEENEIKSYGNLMNIIIYHQTSQQTIPKLSNELFDILINSMSEHKYFVQNSKRENEALKLLNEAKKLGYIFDEKIVQSIKKANEIEYNVKREKRLYMYNLWRDYITKFT